MLIHGITSSSRTWERVLPALADHFTVLAPDLLGHGESAKPRGDYSLGAYASGVRDLMIALGHPRATVVGHSLGGGIAMQLAYQFPERVERLALVSSGGLGREVNLVLRSATLPGAAQVLGVIASAPVLERAEALGRGAQRVGWKPGADIGAIWRGFTSLGDRESRRAFLATTRAVIDIGGQSINAYDHLDAVTPPATLIVWGSKDRMIPAWHALSAQRSVPDCRVELFEGAGHFPHLDDPDRFARVLRDFMTEADGPGVTAGA